MLSQTSALPEEGDVVFETTAPAFNIKVLRGSSVAHKLVDEELALRGLSLPFGSRYATNLLPENSPNLFLAVYDADRACVGGCAMQLRPAPLLKGHSLLRIEQFSNSIPQEAEAAVVSALRKWAESQKRVLRISVDVFSFDPDRRHRVAGHLSDGGFRQAQHVNGYTHTLALDLTPTEDALFAGLHHSARRKIRQLDKNPIELRTIEDPNYEARMNELLLETFHRTGGQIQERDWASRMKLSVAHPEVSRIVGLFRTDQEGPESLLAYAWGCHSGESVFYSEAASTRNTGELRIAVAYGVMWDLIRWAKRTGARTFDFGGVTTGSHSGDDPLGGISDFKRYFSQETVEVREEWLLDNHTWRAALVGGIHRRLRG